MDSTSRGSKITSDSSQLTTNPKFVPRSQTTNNVGGVLQLTDKNETTGRLTEVSRTQILSLVLFFKSFIYSVLYNIFPCNDNKKMFLF